MAINSLQVSARALLSSGSYPRLDIYWGLYLGPAFGFEGSVSKKSEYQKAAHNGRQHMSYEVVARGGISIATLWKEFVVE